MKPWIETKKFWFAMDHVIDDEARGENWRLRRMTPDQPALDRWLDSLITELNESQWEIKAVLPIERSRMYQEIAPLPPEPDPKRARKGSAEIRPVTVDAYGVGWGASATWSVCIIAQRSTWLSDEDYSRRIAAREEGEQKIERDRRRDEARRQNGELEAQIAPLMLDRDRITQAPIAFQKSLFGKSGWQFRDTKYATEADAEAARATALAEVDGKISALRDRLVPLVD